MAMGAGEGALVDAVTVAGGRNREEGCKMKKKKKKSGLIPRYHKQKIIQNKRQKMS